MSQSNIIKSPFKFLKPYESKDADIFFGRDKEINILYDLIKATNIVLLYGPSGTGKTSLMQSGLSKKFYGSDWIPLIVRREGDFNTAISNLFSLVSGKKGKTTLKEHITEIYNKYYRPVYLFLDQFEEVFTLSRDKQKDEEDRIIEVKELFRTINEIGSPICKVIISIREDFLGQLYNYEHLLPSLFDFRLRIEPMNQSKVDEVIEKTFAHFKIKGDTKKISNQITTGQANQNLAYLQVYLDQLWENAYEKSQGNAIDIDTSIIDVVSINDVLSNYIKKCKTNVVSDFNSISGNLAIDDDTVDTILNDFVTNDGTKKPILKTNLYQEPDISIIKSLIEAKLINETDKYYELAHDALAGIIVGSKSQEQKIIEQIIERINSGYKIYVESNQTQFLQDYDLAKYQIYKNKIDEKIETNIKEFIIKSEEKIIQDKTDLENRNAELEYLNIQLTENRDLIKIQNNKLNQTNIQLTENRDLIKVQNEQLSQTIVDLSQSRRNTRFGLIASGILLVLSLIAFWFLFQNRNELNIEKNKADIARKSAESSRDSIIKLKIGVDNLTLKTIAQNNDLNKNVNELKIEKSKTLKEEEKSKTALATIEIQEYKEIIDRIEKLTVAKRCPDKYMLNQVLEMEKAIKSNQYIRKNKEFVKSVINLNDELQKNNCSQSK